MSRASRVPRPAVPPRLAPLIDSWDLAMRAESKADKTRAIYLDAVRWLAGSLPPRVDWPDVAEDITHLRRFFATLAERGYAKSYRNNVGRSLQQWFGWLSVEEDLPNPFAGKRLRVPPPPKLGEAPKPVIGTEDLKLLVKHAETAPKRTGSQRGDSAARFSQRRDAAILRLYMSTGCRLSELLVDLDAVDLARREIAVIGKGGKHRTVRMDAKAVVAVDRYLRERGRHVHAASRALWVGRLGPMTGSGVEQVIERLALAVGLRIHPHLFRHTFAHMWLDAGGTEGDLMELMGWESEQMLRHYGRSARGARARRAYDRVDPLAGI